jgi:hypothetical protein
MSAIPRTIEPERQEVANWLRLFSDERFRKFDIKAYRDHDFIREHCRLGFQHFVRNSVDEAILQTLSRAAEFGRPAILGAPFTPCHWGALAVLLHLFRNGNHDLRAGRTVYWLSTEPRERAMFAKLRIQSRFRRVCEAINVFAAPDKYDDGCSGTSLVFLREVPELSGVRPGEILIVSDGRGELVFRKNEAAELLDKLVATRCAVTLIVPSRNVTYALAPDTVCWPWSEAVLAKAHIRAPHDGDAIPWRWEAGARLAGRTERRVLAIEGLKPIEDLLVDLKGLAYRLFSKPKTFYDLRCRTEFQRIVGVLRQLAVPLEDFDRGDDQRRISARLSRLDADTDGATKEIAEEIKIGLLYARDLVTKLQFSPGKWDLLRSSVDGCIADGRALALAFPQPDPYSAERTLEFVRAYALERGAPLDVRVIAGPDDLPDFEGEVALLGIPKLSQASRWRIPFRGRLTVLAWQFDQFFGNIALHESNASAESVRRRTWSKYFETPLDAHLANEAEVSTVEQESRSGEIAEVDGEIEAFDLSYRGVHAPTETVVSDAIRAKAEYLLMMDDGSTVPAMAGEEHHVLISSYAGNAVKNKTTSKLQTGDQIILINGESYSHLSKRLREEVDRASSLLSFNELMERWQMLCLEQDDDDDTRENFVRKIGTLGCDRGRATIMSWLKLKRMGPERWEDIAAAALAAGDFDLAHSAKHFWNGLEQQRDRHRRLGYWLKKALAKSAGADSADGDKIVDSNLGLTFGDLQRGIRVRTIVQIKRPQASAEDE